MPTYTFSCRCGGVLEVVRRISDYQRPVKCPKCGRRMARFYRAPQVVRDTYRHDLDLSSVLAPSGNPAEHLTASTRGEAKRILEASNRAHGTALVWEGIGHVEGRKREA